MFCTKNYPRPPPSSCFFMIYPFLLLITIRSFSKVPRAVGAHVTRDTPCSYWPWLLSGPCDPCYGQARYSLPVAGVVSGPAQGIMGPCPGAYPPHLCPSLLSFSLIHPSPAFPLRKVFFWSLVVVEETFGRGRRRWKGSRLIKAREEKKKEEAAEEQGRRQVAGRRSRAEISPALCFSPSKHIASREVCHRPAHRAFRPSVRVLLFLPFHFTSSLMVMDLDHCAVPRRDKQLRRLVLERKPPQLAADESASGILPSIPRKQTMLTA